MEESIHNIQSTLTDVIHVLEASERNLYTAAEQTENRAAKLLLKAYAQQRAYFVQQLRGFAAQLQEEPSPVTTSDPGGFLRRGWSELRAAMTIRRQHRQRLLLQDLLPYEETTLNTIAQAQAKGLPTAIDEVIRQQHEQLRKSYRRLEILAGQSQQQLVLRLFDRAEQAEKAVNHLEENGIAADDIAVTTMEAVPVYAEEHQARPHATGEAILTGSLLGLLFGAVLGVIYGFFHISLFPELNGLFATEPLGILIEMSLYWALTISGFSLIFSALISRNAAEIDTYLYQDSFQHGNRLVAVFAKPKDVSKIERIIGLRHEHEIEPVAA